MQVTKIELTNGQKYHCLPTSENRRRFIKNCTARGQTIEKMTNIEMSTKEYYAIPATMDSNRMFS